jgi:ribosomal protein S18 acetylase RimI-like enzyme
MEFKADGRCCRPCLQARSRKSRVLWLSGTWLEFQLLDRREIEDLPNWAISENKRLARDVAFARRATSHLRLLEGGSDPLALHRMYVATVLKQGGTVRYTQQYFVRLVAAAQRSTQIRIFHVQGTDGVNLGFAVLAMDGGTGHYLHAAIDVSVRAMGVSDLLLSHLVAMAQKCGMRRFSLMASPANQLGLLRFKRKWGDREGATITHDIGNGLVGRALVGTLGLRSDLADRVSQKRD